MPGRDALHWFICERNAIWQPKKKSRWLDSRSSHTYAGDAQTDLLAALDAAREGDFEKAEQLHKDASDALIGAHDTQTKLLSQEAGGGEMEMTFIMAHAQDTLMTTMILEKQTRFTIDAYKRIAELEAKLA